MARLNWNAFGERFYETGVDRGVLYVDGIGVAWTGLISVSESPSGGEARPFYLDGIKFLNLSAAEEFEATLNSLYSPPEFGPCDGMSSVSNGLFVTQQPRKSFGLSYRTKLGNDTEGSDHAYKIHLIYNALAAPSQRANNTQGDSSSPAIFSWNITTLPPSMTGYRPTAHLTIDSRTTSPALLSDVEDILYGDDSGAASLPSAQALIDMFSA
jgi:hypothetical protein